MPPVDETSQEKPLEPTQRKIDEAKERGDFPRSREITTVAVFFLALVFFKLGQDFFLEHIMRAASFFLRFEPLMDLTEHTVSEFFWMVLLHLAPILLPVLVLVFLVAVSAEVGQIGVRSVKDPFEPRWDRLDPAKGLKRIFSLRQFVEGIKSIVKLAIIGLVAYITIRGAMPDIASMSQNTPAQGAKIMADIALRLGFRTCAVFAFFAGFDYWFQRWQYLKGLRMTHQERKEELRQTEGDPILRARMRSVQMEIARKRMMTAVPKSDVVITNPTHYAVALRYDPERDPAPVVVAKGQNYVAWKIREIAEKAGIPLVENPPLARALYKQVDVGRQIPASLFRAVAQVLATIWKLAEKRGRNWVQRKAPVAAV
jgi:flagellar biosynthetic protein FlhB